ncbi:MAG: ribosome assembly RNA-binding protein YhbY [Treponema sp.]|nr:ribosome assembly RNA-binding protein YhbY [Treponema sp.]
MNELTSKQRKILEKAAHKLNPVVIIGQNGVTDSLIKMVDATLQAHELIKVKFNEFKEDRHSFASDIAQKTNAALVSIIGNVALFYRQNENPEKRKFKI